MNTILSSEISHKIIGHYFGANRQAMIDEAHVLSQKVYEATVPEGVRDAMGMAAEGIFEPCDELSIHIGREKAFNLPLKNPVPSCAVLENTIVISRESNAVLFKELEKAFKKFDAAEKTVSAAVDTVLTAITPFATVEELVAHWPELAEIIEVPETKFSGGEKTNITKAKTALEALAA